MERLIYYEVEGYNNVDGCTFFGYYGPSYNEDKKGVLGWLRKSDLSWAKVMVVSGGFEWDRTCAWKVWRSTHLHQETLFKAIYADDRLSWFRI